MEEPVDAHTSRGHQQPRSFSYNHDSNARRILLAADEFVTPYHLDHVRDVIRKGALLADDPSDWERVEGLAPSEESALIKERNNYLLLSSMFVMSCVFPLVYAIICGYTLAPLAFPYMFPYHFGGLLPESHLGVMLQYIPFLSSTLVVCWLTPTLNRLWGRRGAMLAGSIGTFIAAVLLLSNSTFDSSWVKIVLAITFSILERMSVGLTTCTCLIYLAEICPSAARGSILTLYPLGMSIGYTLTSAGTIILDGDQSVSPQLSTAFDLIPKGGCPFLILLGWESPRWYARQGYWDKAFESLRRLRTSDILAARDLYHIHTWYKEKEAAFEQQHSTFSKCSSRLLVDPHMRRATLASVSVMVAGSLAGTGLTTAALVHVAYACRLTMRFCVLIVPITTLVFVVTKAGLPRLPRRQLYLASLFFIFCISFALCFIPPLAFQLPTLILLCISSVISVVGLGLVSFLYAAEVFPPSHRDVGVALSICIYQICQILVAAFIFLVWGKIDFHILTWVLTVVNLLSLLAVYLFMRESKQYTLEEMQSTFKMSTREFIVYRLRTDFINPFQRYVLRRRVRVQPVEAQGIASYSVPYTDEEAVSLASQP